jgi:tRNA-dihydrouridine synthase
MNFADTQLRDRPLFLAPMEDVTDASFRFICKQYGVDMMYTEFVSADGLIRDAYKTRLKLNISDQERPLGSRSTDIFPKLCLKPHRWPPRFAPR